MFNTGVARRRRTARPQPRARFHCAAERYARPQEERVADAVKKTGRPQWAPGDRGRCTLRSSLDRRRAGDLKPPEGVVSRRLQAIRRAPAHAQERKRKYSPACRRGFNRLCLCRWILWPVPEAIAAGNLAGRGRHRFDAGSKPALRGDICNCIGSPLDGSGSLPARRLVCSSQSNLRPTH